MKFKLVSTIIVIALFAPWSALACDLCAVHNLLAIDEGEANSWSIGVSEQLSSYGTVQQADQEIENPSEQYLRSSVAQITLGYKPFERVGFQLTAPVIYRRFRRIEAGERDDGSVGGLGDIALLARYQPYRQESNDTTLSITLLGGIKLPTGDASRLGGHDHGTMINVASDDANDIHQASEGMTDVDMTTEETMGENSDSNVHDDDGHDHATMHGGASDHTEEISAIHGHDLALGSGSVDLVSGISGMARYKKAFLSGNMQYALRSEGSYNYRFGDDFQWTFGPGVYLALNEEKIIMLRAAFSGEAKGRDVQNGNKENDTGMISYFAGPEASLIVSSRLRIDAGVDLPLEIKNTGTQVVADYRIRGAVSYRF